MAQPSTTYPFATADGSTIEPSDSAKLSGFAANDKPPARWHNWLFNGAHQWFEYVKNLPTESDFVDKAFNWTGAHRFLGGLRSDTDIAMIGEALYVDGTAPGGRKPRQTQIPATSFVEEFSSGNWYFMHMPTPPENRGWYKHVQGNAGAIIGEFMIPNDSRLAQVELAVMPGGVTLTMECGFIGNGIIGEFPGSVVYAGTPVTYAVDNVRTILPVYPPNMDYFSSRFYRAYVRIHASAGGVANVFWAKAFWDDPGPRNF